MRSIHPAVLFAAVLVAFAAAPRAALADDRASIEAGRAAGRALLVLRDPAVCAIALLRARCRADVDAFLGTTTDADYKNIPKIGPHPASGLRAFVSEGDRDAFDRALVYINSRFSTPAMWSADARDAALYDAGVEDVLLPAAGENQAVQLLSSGALLDLTSHASRIPPDALGIEIRALPQAQPGTASQVPAAMLGTGNDLVRAIDARLPPAPIADVRAGTGSASIAALGVASSTVAELIDSPSWLFEADSQRFVDAYADRMRAFAPGASVRIDTLRAATRPGAGFSHAGAITAYNALLGAALSPNSPSARAFVSGAFSAQIVYNAAVLRDSKVGAMMSGFLAGADVLDGVVPGWREARAGGTSSTDWKAQYRLGIQLVDLIEKAGTP